MRVKLTLLSFALRYYDGPVEAWLNKTNQLVKMLSGDHTTTY
jgi:hypothetical protein